MTRRDRKPAEMAITEHELNAMTAELDMLHQSTFPQVRENLSEFAANVVRVSPKQALARRNFLMGMGGAVLLGGLAARGSKSSAASSPATSAAAAAATSAATSAKASASPYTGDLQVVALAAALENLAVTAYKGALTMAGAGTYGKVPPGDRDVHHDRDESSTWTTPRRGTAC